MKVKQLDHLNMTVRNFDETADWYARVFGFEIVEKGTYQGNPWGVLKSGDAMLCVYEHPEFEGTAGKRNGTHGVNHFALRITDRAGWLATVERENLKLDFGGEVDWLHSKAWYVSDPTGYGIEVALWDDDTPAFG